MPTAFPVLRASMSGGDHYLPGDPHVYFLPSSITYQQLIYIMIVMLTNLQVELHPRLIIYSIKIDTKLIQTINQQHHRLTISTKI